MSKFKVGQLIRCYHKNGYYEIVSIEERIVTAELQQQYKYSTAQIGDPAPAMLTVKRVAHKDGSPLSGRNKYKFEEDQWVSVDSEQIIKHLSNELHKLKTLFLRYNA